jgi:hypothetical protein
MGIHFRRTPLLGLIGVLALGGASVARAQDTSAATRQDTSAYRSSQNQADTMQDKNSKGKSLSTADTVVCKDGSNSPNSAKGACGSHGGVDTAATWAALKARGGQPSGQPTSKDTSSSSSRTSP